MFAYKSYAQMLSTRRFTSSLPANVLEDLSHMADSLGVPMNSLIETALRNYLIELKRKDFAESFARAAEDKDQNVLAESGITDYEQLIDSL